MFSNHSVLSTEMITSKTESEMEQQMSTLQYEPKTMAGDFRCYELKSEKIKFLSCYEGIPENRNGQ